MFIVYCLYWYTRVLTNCLWHGSNHKNIQTHEHSHRQKTRQDMGVWGISWLWCSLKLVLQASGTLKRLPDGSSWKEWWRRWEGSSVISLAFLITARLYSSDRGGWGSQLFWQPDSQCVWVLFCVWWWVGCTRKRYWKWELIQWGRVKMSLQTWNVLSFLSRWRRCCAFLYVVSVCCEKDTEVSISMPRYLKTCNGFTSWPWMLSGWNRGDALSLPPTA